MTPENIEIEFFFSLLLRLPDLNILFSRFSTRNLTVANLLGHGEDGPFYESFASERDHDKGREPGEDGRADHGRR